MWNITALVLLLSLCIAVRAAEKPKAGTEEFSNFFEAKDAAFANEEKKLWKQIHWQHSSAEALKLAQKEKKPIVVFFLVDENGKPGAQQC